MSRDTHDDREFVRKEGVVIVPILHIFRNPKGLTITSELHCCSER
jgi:hypothetical protein